MQNFKKILNILAATNEATPPVVQNVSEYNASEHPCCLAVKEIDDAYSAFLRINFLSFSSLAQREYLHEHMLEKLSKIIDLYCECQYPTLQQLEREILILGTKPLPSKVRECENKINTFINKGIFKQFSVITELETVTQRFPHATYFKLLNRYISKFLTKIINHPEFEDDIIIETQNPNNRDNSSFFRGFCNIRRRKPNANTIVEEIKAEMLDENLVGVDDILHLIESIVGTREDPEAVTPDCPPSPNDPSIVSLATAVGATAIAAGTVVWLFLRKRAKKCTSVVTAARGLTGAIMTQFEGSSASSEQLDQEEINRIAQEIIEKECTGVLPRSCQEGGFEGGGSQPPGGETEPPSGGGGGMTGGDGVL
jgi:hypothetical protein